MLQDVCLSLLLEFPLTAVLCFLADGSARHALFTFMDARVDCSGVTAMRMMQGKAGPDTVASRCQPDCAHRCWCFSPARSAAPLHGELRHNECCTC